MTSNAEALHEALATARIAAKALELGCDNTLTGEQMDAIAHEVGVSLPLSYKIRDAVHIALTDPLTDGDPNQAFADATMNALDDGWPFRYTSDGRTVLLIPVPVER